MNMKPWQTQEKKRSEAYEELDKNGKKVLLLNDPAGTGKSIFCLKLSFKHNRNTMLFANNHKLAMQFSKEWMKYNESFEIGYLASRTYPLTEDQKELISFILGEEITQDYACTRCSEDTTFRKMVLKGYWQKNECVFCKYKYNGNCVYYRLMLMMLEKLDSDDDNRLFLLVKPYIYTGFVKNLLKKNIIEGTIFDEGFLNLTYTALSYGNSRMVRNYIAFIDDFLNRRKKLEEEYKNLTDEFKKLKHMTLIYDDFVKIWFPVKKLIRLIINNNRDEYNANQKKTRIYYNLIEFRDKFDLKDVQMWYDDLKSQLYKENYQNNLKNIQPNKFTTLENMLEDVYKISNDDLKHRLMVDEDNLVFTYIKDTREKIIDIIQYDKNKTIIPSASLTKEMFEDILPVFKDLYIEQRDNELKSLFKAIYIYTCGAYPKYSLYDAFTREFSDAYDNLLEVLKKLIIRHRTKKILIVAFKIIKDQLKEDLKYFLKEYNINAENIQFEHYFNTEGLNKYEDFDVGILFGACGLPKELITILSKLWNVSEKKLTDFFIKSPMLQSMERLRSVNDPHNKIIYQLSNIMNENYPTEQIIYFNKIGEDRYKEFLEKLEEVRISNTNECLDIYNSCDYERKINKRQMSNILNELTEQLFLEEIPIKEGDYRPVFYYKIIKKD